MHIQKFKCWKEPENYFYYVGKRGDHTSLWQIKLPNIKNDYDFEITELLPKVKNDKIEIQPQDQIIEDDPRENELYEFYQDIYGKMGFS